MPWVELIRVAAAKVHFGGRGIWILPKRIKASLRIDALIYPPRSSRFILALFSPVDFNAVLIVGVNKNVFLNHCS